MNLIFLFLEMCVRWVDEMFETAGTFATWVFIFRIEHRSVDLGPGTLRHEIFVCLEYRCLVRDICDKGYFICNEYCLFALGHGTFVTWGFDAEV